MLRIFISVLCVSLLLGTGAAEAKASPRKQDTAEMEQKKEVEARKKADKKLAREKKQNRYMKEGVNFHGVWKYMGKVDKKVVDTIFIKVQHKRLGDSYKYKKDRNPWGAPNFEKLWNNLTPVEKAIVDAFHSKYHPKR